MGDLLGGVVGCVVAHEILVSAQGPLVLGFWVSGFLGFGAKGWGPGLDIVSLSRPSPRQNKT